MHAEGDPHGVGAPPPPPLLDTVDPYLHLPYATVPFDLLPAFQRCEHLALFAISPVHTARHNHREDTPTWTGLMPTPAA